jgi:hypothetical protein
MLKYYSVSFRGEIAATPDDRAKVVNAQYDHYLLTKTVRRATEILILVRHIESSHVILRIYHSSPKLICHSRMDRWTVRYEFCSQDLTILGIEHPRLHSHQPDFRWYPRQRIFRCSTSPFPALIVSSSGPICVAAKVSAKLFRADDELLTNTVGS